MATYDAIVVGLGPAGSTAAYGLAKAGLKVLALDKQRFPRYKSCGGHISTKIAGALDFDISRVIEHTVMGVTFTYRSERPLDIISDRLIGHNVMREHFDLLLLDEAREAGAEVIEGCAVKGVIEAHDSVRVLAKDGQEFSARVLVAADGAFGFIGREYFGIDPRKCSVTVTAEMPCDATRLKELEGKLFIDYGRVPNGYGWIFPKKEFLSVGIAGSTERAGGKLRHVFDAFVQSHEVLEGLTMERRVGWAVPDYYGPDVKVTRGRIVLVGDTGHLVDPFLGEGIYFAIKSAQAASRFIIESIRSGRVDLTPYQEWVERELYPEFRSLGRLADLVYTHPRLWYRIIEAEPDIMLRYYDVIRGDEDCAVFYDWIHGKVRSKPWKVFRRWVESRFIPA